MTLAEDSAQRLQEQKTAVAQFNASIKKILPAKSAWAAYPQSVPYGKPQ